MTKRVIYTIPIILMLLLFSCETTEKIDDFPLRPSRLVLNSYFTPDSSWAFQLSKSLSVLDNAEIQYVDDAKIKIFKNSVLIDSVTAPDETGLYRSFKTPPVAKGNYSIEVSAPGFKNALLSSDFAPAPVSISKVEVGIIDSSFYYENYYDPYQGYISVTYGNVKGTFSITIDDPDGIDNYYQLSVYTYNIYLNYDDTTKFNVEKRPISFSTDDQVADDNDSNISELVFNDEIFDGQKYQLKLEFEDWDASKDRKYNIELISLSRAAYLYKRSVKEYLKSSGDPFSEPVLIYSNIENGYGIFAGYAISNFTVNLFD